MINSIIYNRVIFHKHDYDFYQTDDKAEQSLFVYRHSIFSDLISCVLSHIGDV